MPKRWVFRTVEPDRRSGFAQNLSISPVTAAVLLGRGVATLSEARAWLSSQPCVPHDPFLLPDMERAVDRLHRAVRERELICFYGDYDVDGVSAISLYLLFFKAMGARVLPYVPERVPEGYGLNENAIVKLARQGVSLLVTADCGTTSCREVQLAQRLGIDVIITDHHQVADELPDGFACLNPHRVDSVYPFSGLCSGGLAYKVVQAYGMKYGAGDVCVESLLDVVALATIADMVPLLDENRVFVQDGLERMSRGERCGLRVLKRKAAVDGVTTTGSVAFRLAPRINAAGRLSHAMIAVRLLTTTHEREAEEAADQLESLNRSRRSVEEQVVAEAVQLVGDEPASGLVVAGRGWHTGVVGIVASRFVERFHRPAVVIGLEDNGVGRGSVRSVPGFDVYQALHGCRELLQAFGGHPSAAGLTIHERQIEAFRERFVQHVDTWTNGTEREPTLGIDAEVRLSDIVPRVIKELERLQPYGTGNPEPVLVARQVDVLDSRTVGEGHLKLTVRHARSVPFESIGFRMGHLADRTRNLKHPIDVAFVPELQRWQGLDRIQLRLCDLKTPALPEGM